MESEAVQTVRSHYGLSDNFPFHNLVMRASQTQERNNLFLVSELVQQLLKANAQGRLRIVFAGIRCFTRCDSGEKIDSTNTTTTTTFPSTKENEDAPVIENDETRVANNAIIPSHSYRIQYEALSLLFPFVSTRKWTCTSFTDLLTLLEVDYPLISLFSPEFQETINNKDSFGCYLLSYEASPEHRFEAPVWKGKSSLNLLVNKKEKKSLCERWQ
jgi:hypothetical protein